MILSALITSLLFCSHQAVAQPRMSSDRHVVAVDQNIAESQLWGAGEVHIIAAEVHVLPGVSLTIADGAEIRIVNGRTTAGQLGSNALVFDSGSSLIAERFSVMAANGFGEAVNEADNGGLWFMGTWREAEKDGLRVVDFGSGRHSRFTAVSISTQFLGRRDVDATQRRVVSGDDDDDAFGDDIDGISLLGLGRSEWRVGAITSIESGDDGFDVTNSNIRLDSLTVENPTEDGLNISSSRVEILHDLQVSMTESRAPDRELFDLEVDDGPSYVILARGSEASLYGYFGDEMIVESADIPLPTTDRYYRFSGVMKRGVTEIYSLSED